MVILSLLTALAGRYAMPQNHPEYRWQTLTTAHFKIHYPVSRHQGPRAVDGGPVAQRLAEVAEPLWLTLCSEIDYFPDRPIQVVILEDTDLLVGFTLTHQGWIVFSGNPGPELARMRGRSDWVKDLLAHELAHVISLKKSGWLEEKTGSYGLELGGLVEAGGSQVGGAITIQDAEPYWFSEGAAEFWSERAGVNWWTSARDMTLRASALEGRLLKTSEWGEESGLDGWYESERAYQMGYAFHRWFAAEYGDGAWRDVMESSSRKLWLDWSQVFREAVGVPLDELKKRFEEDLLARSEEQVRAIQARGEVSGRELSLWTLGWTETGLRGRDRWSELSRKDQVEKRENTGTMSLHSAYSADGTWFARQRSGWTEVIRVDEEMWSVFAGEIPDWRRTDAQRKAAQQQSIWLSSRYASDVDFVPGHDELVLVEQEGANLSPLAPDHTKWTQLYRVNLSAEERRRGKERYLSLDLTDSKVRSRYTPIPGTLRAMDPSVSPSGEWLAYTQYNGGSSNLVVSRLDGSERREITSFRDGTWIQGTDWSPDGTQIVAAVHENHQQNLWIFDVVTGEVEVLMRDGWEEHDPFWAGDGSIWFSADLDGIYDIFRRSADGEIARMTRVTTGAFAPTLTPKGSLLYSHYTAYGWKTYGIRSSELAWKDVTDRFGSPEIRQVIAPPKERPVTRYRPGRAFLPVALSPSLRFDRAVDGRILPRVGAYLRVRDAVELHTLTLQGWIGADAYASARWDWHGLWPNISLFGSHHIGRFPFSSDRRMITMGGAEINLPWKKKLEIDLGWHGFSVRSEAAQGFEELHRSSVWTVGLRAGKRVIGDPTRIYTAQQWQVSRGDSVGGGVYAYHRLEWNLEAVVRPQSFGYSSSHRLVVSAVVGLTDRRVAVIDALKMGGDHPYALRKERFQATIPFPGYAPYAITAQHAGVAGLGWRFPLAHDLDAHLGPLTIQHVYGQLGGHIGAALIGDHVPLLADGVGEIRVYSRLYGGRFHSVLRTAYGRPTSGLTGGLRTVVSIGSSF